MIASRQKGLPGDNQGLLVAIRLTNFSGVFSSTSIFLKVLQYEGERKKSHFLLEGSNNNKQFVLVLATLTKFHRLDSSGI